MNHCEKEWRERMRRRKERDFYGDNGRGETAGKDKSTQFFSLILLTVTTDIKTINDKKIIEYYQKYDTASYTKV